MAKPAHDIAGIAVDTAPQQQPRVIGRPFPKGVSGNPAGRPRSARSRVSESFLSDLAEAWEKHGKAALTACAISQPEVLIKTVASLLPRDVDISVDLRVEHAVSALEAYRLLKATPAAELRQIEHQADAEDA
jgi:hypothetical protein